MNKSKKSVMLIILSILIIPLIGVLIIECWYLPRYLFGRKQVELSNNNTSQITIMSSNLRTFSPTDLFTKSWFYRAELISEDINEVGPDIIGFQEYTTIHNGYIKDILQGYDSIVTYRDNSLFGESCPIFYRQDKFELIDSGCFWLSDTPDQISIGWNSAYPRICSYVILKEISQSKPFIVFNTHLDNVSKESQINSLELINSKKKELGGYPSILMGDFNAYVGSQTINKAYKLFDDANIIAENNLQAGQSEATYHCWGQMPDHKRIDYFMVSKSGINVKTYDVLDQTHAGGGRKHYSSDHYPIYIKIDLL